jgi:hypothetical protein
MLTQLVNKSGKLKKNYQYKIMGKKILVVLYLWLRELYESTKDASVLFILHTKQVQTDPSKTQSKLGLNQCFTYQSEFDKLVISVFI